MNRKRFAALTAAIMIVASPAAAQVAPGAADTPGSKDVIPEKMAPAPTQGRSVAPGNTLDRSNGVTSPLAVDPDASKPATAPNTSGSVVPTPGTPGGSQAVQPN